MKSAEHALVADSAPSSEGEAPLRSVFTNTILEWLTLSGHSLLVTTYQAGHLIVLRADGSALNTHFRRYPRPMGLAFDEGRLAVGIAREIVQFRNMAALTVRLDPPGKHDACYLPRASHITGDIDVHEMAWGQQELWFVNTRFSCLCTLDDEHSFVPRWRPTFVTGYSAEDRCHLNGLAVVDGHPKYVTALGATDTCEGWRANKARGGVLVDVESNDIVAAGLSMPHSPRWHAGRLWLLESGDGSLGTIDLRTGRYEVVVKLDGFTRGLAFLGPYALVGLSQVRESATFGGLPITERIAKRICGVALVDLRAAREVGFVHFEDAVQEIFSLELLPHRFPELLEPTHELVGSSYALPETALAEVRPALPGRCCNSAAQATGTPDRSMVDGGAGPRLAE